MILRFVFVDRHKYIVLVKSNPDYATILTCPFILQISINVSKP